MGTKVIFDNTCCSSCNTNPITTENIETNYNAMSDKFLMPIENNYNLLLKIPFNEYVKVLLSFSQSGPFSMNTNINKNNNTLTAITFQMLDEPITEEVFNNFLTNKIISNDLLYNYTLENDKQTLTLFKDLLIETYRDFRKNFSIYSEDKYNIVRKYHLLALGMVYCSGKIKDKTELIFKLFKSSSSTITMNNRGNNCLYRSQDLNRFMLSCFLFPSCCQVFARMRMAMKYPFLGDISKEDMLSILDAFELSDLERLVKIVNGVLFKEKSCLNMKEFSDVVKDNKMEWMFCPSGIRFNLEKFNDVKDRSAFIPADAETKSESERS